MGMIILEKISCKKPAQWSETIKSNKSIKLHMIGKLQSNKAKKAVDLFHYIHFR